VSRKRGRARRRRQPAGLLGNWTIQRATGVGVVSGLAAILMAGLIDTSGDLVYPYALLLALTALCGASVLWITATDMRSRGTTGRMRAIRWFDAALGIALLLPSLYALSEVRPELGL
jgi:hypothetical protein